MPKKSTKSKSKRMSLKQKYKIIKKVKEHHKKKKKELKVCQALVVFFKLRLKSRFSKTAGRHGYYRACMA